MRITWLGHASFLITAQDGTRIITDPYKPGSFDGAVRYKPINEEADIVFISHEHDDHNYTGDIKGTPVIVRDTREQKVKGVSLKGVSCFHDTSQGNERGPNIMFTFEVDGLRISHLGDIGHELSAVQCEAIGEVDILFIPVGGFYTIDDKDADRMVESLNPRVVIPMHFKTDALGFPIAEIDPFIQGKKNVKRIDDSEVEITREDLPENQEIWVLDYARCYSAILLSYVCPLCICGLNQIRREDEGYPIPKDR